MFFHHQPVEIRCEDPRARPERTLWQGRALPQHEGVAIQGNDMPQCAALFYGRYWARTSDPQLVDPPASFPPNSARFGLFRKKPLFSEVSAAFEPIADKRWQTTYREFRHCSGTASVSRPENASRMAATDF